MCHYLKLFRLDVCIIAFASYLIGVRLVTSVSVLDCLIALAVSIVSTNFIYSFNAWANWQIDAINKPQRPIPSGLLSPRAAFKYSMVLLFLSVLYPFFVANSGWTLCLFMLLPALGLMYSAKHVSLRRYHVASVIIISIGLIIPIQLGYYMHCIDFRDMPFFFILFVFCLSIVPLKDIEDIHGDIRFGIQNLFHTFGRRLLIISIVGFLIDAVLLIFMPIRLLLKAYALILILSSALMIVIFWQRPRRIYTAIIWIVIAEGFFLFAFL